MYDLSSANFDTMFIILSYKYEKPKDFNNKVNVKHFYSSSLVCLLVKNVDVKE